MNGSPLPDIVYAQASPHSVGGASLPHGSDRIDASTVHAYASEERVARACVERLRQTGFDVLRVSPTGVNIAGPPALYEKVFGTTLTVRDDQVHTSGSHVPGLIDTGNSTLADVLEGVAIETSLSDFTGAAPPTPHYWHLRAPVDIARVLNAAPAHARAVTGAGVHVAMVDTGWYPHPYFAAQGYRHVRVHLGPGATGPDTDETGHGTAESANLFAVAPGVDLTMVKRNRSNVLGAFDDAVGLAPHVISCSWGWSEIEPPLSAIGRMMAASVATAVAEGIVVVCAAGNGEHGFPSQHPDVISAGGVTVSRSGRVRASNGASGFRSAIYPGRSVPDVSGVIGDQPSGVFLVLPVPPGSEVDTTLAGDPFPFRDGTGPADGWAVLSGTSAAAPQVAGVCALIRQVQPAAAPDRVKRILADTARDVRAGVNHPRFHAHAVPGYDTASGWGLIDADGAVTAASRATVPVPREPAPRTRGLSIREARALTEELLGSR